MYSPHNPALSRLKCTLDELATSIKANFGGVDVDHISGIMFDAMRNDSRDAIGCQRQS